MMSTALIQNKKGPTEQGFKFLSQQYHFPHIPKLTRNDLLVINSKSQVRRVADPPTGVTPNSNKFH